jgi:uncharacterized protein YukE
MYNYPAMLAHSADIAGYAGTLQSLSADVALPGRVAGGLAGATPG